MGIELHNKSVEWNQHQQLWILTKPTTKELVTQNPITEVGVLDKALFDTGSVR